MLYYTNYMIIKENGKNVVILLEISSNYIASTFFSLYIAPKIDRSITEKGENNHTAM